MTQSSRMDAVSAKSWKMHIDIDYTISSTFGSTFACLKHILLSTRASDARTKFSIDCLVTKNFATEDARSIATYQSMMHVRVHETKNRQVVTNYCVWVQYRALKFVTDRTKYKYEPI